MAPTGEPSQLQSPPETPESQGQKARMNESNRASENQPHTAPEVMEAGDKVSGTDRFDDDSAEENEKEDDDVESIHHIPSFQQTPIRPRPPSSFPNGTGYKSPPASEFGSPRASRRGRAKAQGRQMQTQVMPQSKEQHYAPDEAPESFNTVLNRLPQSGYERQKNIVGPRVPKNSLRQSRGAQEHPLQVPARVVNPQELAPPKAEAKGGNASLRVKLDLNLEVEIMLKASIKGDLTLALFN